MDKSGSEENFYQGQNPIQNYNKPTYLTTYQQFLSSQLRLDPQTQDSVETNDKQPNKKIVLSEQNNRSVQNPQIQFLDSNQLDMEGTPKCKEKRDETDSFLESLNLTRNKKHDHVSNIDQDSPSDTDSITYIEPVTELHELMELDEPVTAYECKICSLETIYEDVFKEHMLTHRKKETFHKCPKCNFKMKCKASIRKHMAIEDDDIVYCGLHSYSKECRGDLALHLKVHKKRGMHRAIERS